MSVNASGRKNSDYQLIARSVVVVVEPSDLEVDHSRQVVPAVVVEVRPVAVAVGDRFRSL